MSNPSRNQPASAPWHDCLVTWRCEQHPDKDWPHDDCPGPGEPRPLDLEEWQQRLLAGETPTMTVPPRHGDKSFWRGILEAIRRA